MKKKVLVLFKNQSNEEFFYRNKNLFLQLIKNFKEIQFINLKPNLNNRNINTYDKYFLNFFNFNDLKKFINKNHKFICIIFLEKHFNNLKYFRLLNKKRIFLIEIFRGGELREAKYFFYLNFFNILKKIYKIYFQNINFLIYFFLYLFKFIPKTDILFHYNKNLKDQIGYCFNDSYKTTFSKILKANLFKKKFFFKKTIIIKPKSYDELINTKKNIYKYLVFLDSCFDHRDRSEYDKKPTEKEKFNYYKEIELTFKNIKNFVFCAHPNTNIKELKFYLNNIKIVKFNTNKYIKKSKIIFFHESSSILDALYLKKKILLMDSDFLGQYFKFRNNLYSKFLNLNPINLSTLHGRSKVKKIINNKNVLTSTEKNQTIYPINRYSKDIKEIILILKRLKNN